jgi:methylase of polypeptide subunit release factors
VTQSIGPQSFRNGEVHDWYRLVLGYSDHLVANIIDEFQLKAGAAVLDPFCGSGTTVVECKKRGVNCWAVDANPASWFAARVKTNWNLIPAKIIAAVDQVCDGFSRIRRNRDALNSDPTYMYLEKSGMLDRGWISRANLWDVLAIKWSVRDLRISPPYKEALFLAAMNELVHTASNVRFGPELYCSQTSERVNVLSHFRAQVRLMAKDLEIARASNTSSTHVILGDSRKLSRSWLEVPRGGFDAVICSPPYPAEHDYTRNSRLELAFLEHVTDLESLRAIKKTMVRSHSKGIYVGDVDFKLVDENGRIARLAKRIDAKAKDKDYGFAKLYGQVTKEYFGGMKRHLRALRPLLRKKARCAYIVGDQASYFQTRISTAQILSEIAEQLGFEVESIRVWRRRWVNRTQRYLSENVLLLRNG